MLHSRNPEQENLTHAHQVAGAAKSNALAPKTPGPQQAGKTPARRVPLNDENTVFRTGKGKAKDPLQTPAPRDRAPLGAKTTNAKAKPFATPAAPVTANKQPNLKTPAQQRAASARKNKLRVHHSPRSQLDDTGPLDAGPDADTTTSNDLNVDNDSEPEIETANRLPEPEMPDPVFDVQIDHSFPMLRPENIMRGAYEMYLNPVGEDGLTFEERRSKQWDDEAEVYFEAERKRLTEEALRIDWSELDRLCGDEPKKNLEVQKGRKGHMTTKTTLQDRKPPGDAVSKSAVSALSTGPRSTQQRSASAATSRFAAPTAASQAKQATVAKATNHDSSALSHNRTRNAAGPMASRTTIGRAKGRQVSAELRAGQPTMAEGKKPSASVGKEEENRAHFGQSQDIIAYLAQQYKDEQAKEAGIKVSLDEDGIDALQDALNEDILESMDPDFQLDLPESADDE